MADPYFSEIKYLGGRNLDFIEVAVDPDTDISDLVITIYFADGTIRSTNTLIGITATRVGGKDVYVMDTTSSGTFNGVALSNGVSLSNTAGDVFSFVSFDDTAAPVIATEGPANGITSTEIGMAGAGSSLESDDGGLTYQVQDDPTPGAIPCLTTGTKVSTLRGEVAVECLQVGDMLCTIDGVDRPLVAVIQRHIARRDLLRNHKLFPIRICAGALGCGLPKRDLLVSRQHRMLVSSLIAERMFGVSDVLVAAIKLTELPGVYIDRSVRSVSYFHLVFDVHEVIFAEGAPTESLLLAAGSKDAMPVEAYRELEALFPHLFKDAARQKPKRLVPDAKQQKRLVARHLSNKRSVLSGEAFEVNA